ncbi:MAG TPA: hypothetical protein VEC99_09085, partial [Clostridia bacterium]|nr:hypothetical protein [Clostridia bacterium]
MKTLSSEIDIWTPKETAQASRKKKQSSSVPQTAPCGESQFHVTNKKMALITPVLHRALIEAAKRAQQNGRTVARD